MENTVVKTLLPYIQCTDWNKMTTKLSCLLSSGVLICRHESALRGRIVHGPGLAQTRPQRSPLWTGVDLKFGPI